MAADGENGTISEAEAALYDRQIRLWGLDAQRRLRASSVLIAGMKGLGAEVAKNIVLSGVKAVTLLDHQQVSEEDFCSQFLVSRGDLGKNRAEASLERTQTLNPNVKVTADTGKVEDKPDEFFTKFNIVCLTCCSQQTLQRVSHVCHGNGVKFYAGDVHGFCGYMFADLGEHDYVEEKPKIIKTDKKEDGKEEGPPAKKAKVDSTETVMIKKTSTFCRWQDSQTVDWTSDASSKALKKTPQMYFIMQILLRFRDAHSRAPSVGHMEEDKQALLRLRDEVLSELKLSTDLVGDEFASHCFAALSPVCAIVGGVLAQEIVKAVSGKDAPHNNFFFFNGIDDSGMVDRIGSAP